MTIVSTDTQVSETMMAWELKNTTKKLLEVEQNQEITSLGDPVHIFVPKELYIFLDLPKLKKACFDLNRIEMDSSDDIWKKVGSMRTDSQDTPVCLLWREIKPILEYYCQGSIHHNNRTLDDVSFMFHMHRTHDNMHRTHDNTLTSRYITHLDNGKLSFSYRRDKYEDDYSPDDIYRCLVIDLNADPMVISNEKKVISNPIGENLLEIIQFLSQNLTKHKITRVSPDTLIGDQMRGVYREWTSKKLLEVQQNPEITSLGDPVDIFNLTELYTFLDVPKLKKACFICRSESDLADNILTKYGIIQTDSQIIKIWDEIQPFFDYYC